MCYIAKHTDFSRQVLSLSTKARTKPILALSSGRALNVILSRAIILLYTSVSAGLRPSRAGIILNFIVCPVYCVNYQLINCLNKYKLIVL
ncbi:hypothetical protein C1646_728952 [Rhizophagus diaphanus]|nr:hypothetical protein C1646_728952 [Rhizophagus diaphanus] [Rhizophagus sp. MUCL 43196]